MNNHMKSDHPIREHLRHLSAIMGRTHKALFQYQLREVEKTRGRIEGAGTHLQLLLTDSEFQWLRPLSQIMVLTDDSIFSKELVPYEVYEARKSDIQKLFIIDQEAEFFKKLNSVCDVLPEIILLIAEIKKSLLLKAAKPAKS